MKSILIRMAWMSFLLIFLSCGFTFAETKTFIREYSCQAADEADKDAARTVALRQVKRLLLEALGTYLENITEIQNFNLKKDQMVILAAGIAKTEIVEEKWDGHTFRLQSKIEADSVDIIQSINALRQDRQRRKELEDVRKRSDALLQEYERLRKAQATGEKNQKDKAAYLKTIKEIGAIEWFETGYQSLVAKRKNEALIALTRAIELNPKFPEAYNNRGIAYEELGEMKRAIQDYSKVIELNPESAIAYNNLGIAYGKLGNYQQAITGYDKAVGLDPQYANVYGNRGNAYRRLGNSKQAINDYSKVIELNPQQALAYFLRGGIYASLGDRNQANVDFKTAAGLGHKKAQNYLTKQGIHWTLAVSETKPSDESSRKPPLKAVAPSLSYKKPPSETVMQAKPSIVMNPRYRSIKAIVLHNGAIIEGRIMSMNAETVKIYVQGKILSYSFQKDIKTFMKEE